MSKKENELKEEVKEEVKEECTCEDCCDCEDFPFDFAPEHKTWSLANVLSISSKVLAIIIFIYSTIYFVIDVVDNINAVAANGQAFGFSDWISVIVYFLGSVIIEPLAILAIGEVINLLNRIKEALY